MLCGNPEQFGDGTPALKLATNRPLYLVEDALPGFSQDVIATWIAQAFVRWGAVADIEATRIGSLGEAGANDVVCRVTVADLGGSGVLADQELPSGRSVLRMRINSRIQWIVTDGPMQGGIDVIRTLTHELGHFLGHQHWPTGLPAELMEPVISNTITRPQPTEGAMSAKWFGPPRPTTPPTPAGQATIRLPGGIVVQSPKPVLIDGARVTWIS